MQVMHTSAICTRPDLCYRHCCSLHRGQKREGTQLTIRRAKRCETVLTVTGPQAAYTKLRRIVLLGAGRHEQRCQVSGGAPP